MFLPLLQMFCWYNLTQRSLECSAVVVLVTSALFAGFRFLPVPFRPVFGRIARYASATRNYKSLVRKAKTNAKSNDRLGLDRKGSLFYADKVVCPCR